MTAHSGLISAFSLHLVKPGRIPIALGRAFNRVEEIRLVADYRGESVDREHAAWAVTQARDADPPYLVLKAMLADGLEQPQQRDDLLRQAFAAFDPLPNLYLRHL